MLSCWCANSVKWCTLVKKFLRMYHTTFHAEPISTQGSRPGGFAALGQSRAQIHHLHAAQSKGSSTVRQALRIQMGCYQNLGDWSCRHFQPLAVVAKPDCKLRPEIQKWNEFSGEVRIPNVQCSHPQVHGTTKSMLSGDRMLCEPQGTKVNGNATANSPAKKGGNEQKGRLR